MDKFYSSTNAEAGRVLRCRDTVISSRAALFSHAKFNNHILFDHDYNDSDTSRMYCSELIEYAYNKAGLSLVGKGKHSINMPGLKLQHVIFPSDFLRSSHLITVAAFTK